MNFQIPKQENPYTTCWITLLKENFKININKKRNVLIPFFYDHIIAGLIE